MNWSRSIGAVSPYVLKRQVSTTRFCPSALHNGIHHTLDCDFLGIIGSTAAKQNGSHVDVGGFRQLIQQVIDTNPTTHSEILCNAAAKRCCDAYLSLDRVF